jgi:simple sugar transport system ATP-binding protein
MAYVEMKNISKRFGTVLANDNISIGVQKGEILALLGENGSGKSTLVSILSGIYAPDSGSIEIAGIPRFFHSPDDAISKGIGIVHQHFMLIPVMTAAENIAMGEKSRDSKLLDRIFINKRAIYKKIDDISKKFGLDIDKDKKVYDMSVGEKQTVEIIKILYRGAQTLILDEPTAVLTPQEIKGLFQILKNMRAENCAVIIITHKLNEVMEISDRVTVLRRGQNIGTVKTAETNAQSLSEMMVGGKLSLEIDRPAAKISEKPVLEVKNLSAVDRMKNKILKNIDFEVYGGEILGLAGIAGSGQRELCEIIAGLMKAETGSILFKNEEILGLNAKAIHEKGVALSFVPEDRLDMGLAGGMSITDNILLRIYDKTRGIFIDRGKGKTDAEAIVRRYDISTPSVAQIVRKLSGGNIQKVLLGREIENNPSFLMTAYPVRGLDIGASMAVYDILNRQKKKGVAILCIGEDLDVLQQLSDRIMVFHAGELMDIVDARSVTKEDIGLLMLGHKQKAA